MNFEKRINNIDKFRTETAFLLWKIQLVISSVAWILLGFIFFSQSMDESLSPFRNTWIAFSLMILFLCPSLLIDLLIKDFQKRTEKCFEDDSGIPSDKEVQKSINFYSVAKTVISITFATFAIIFLSGLCSGLKQYKYNIASILITLYASVDLSGIIFKNPGRRSLR